LPGYRVGPLICRAPHARSLEPAACTVSSPTAETLQGGAEWKFRTLAKQAPSQTMSHRECALTSLERPTRPMDAGLASRQPSSPIAWLRPENPGKNWPSFRLFESFRPHGGENRQIHSLPLIANTPLTATLHHLIAANRGVMVPPMSKAPRV